MPIFVTDYKWIDSLQRVVVTLPLKGIEPSKVDVVLTNEYLKISFPPYIFECFFFKPVLVDESSSVAASGLMQVNLVKAVSETWSQLMIDNADDKSVTRPIREAALRAFSERLQAASSAARASRRANAQLSLQEQMKLEEADRARIEAAKQSERDAAMCELEEFRVRQQQLRDHAKRLFKEEMLDADRSAASDATCAGQETCASLADDLAVAPPPGRIFDSDSSADFPGDSHPVSQQRHRREAVETVLGIREPGRIGVTFTARVFPTPERESQRALEDEWLRKQAERRRAAEAVAGVSPDLSDRERDPVWLRDKGNQLFAAGNYLAAVNAYTHALEQRSEMHSLYSNRAACHLKLGNLFKAMEDASRALELLQPPVEQNRLARVRAHCRRAAALTGLGAHPEAATELREAARLEPGSAEIAEDLRRVTELAQGRANSGDELDDVDD